jgi:hypothetical protein
MIRQVVFGTATYIPGLYSLVTRGVREGDSARYCYAVWLRHLAMAHHRGLNARPRVVVELGPGTSLGVGLAALISGSDSYCAGDVVQHESTSRNLQIFDELVDLFRRQEPIPGDSEFPRLRPRLTAYGFPGTLRSPSEWREALDDARLARIRESVAAGPGEGRALQYVVPWQRAGGIPDGVADMVCSQAVLQYVDDLATTYQKMAGWLAPGGIMSHTVDFSAHQTSDQWDGHWAYSPLVWRLMRGRRPYWLNRAPCSRHVSILRELGLEVIDTVRETQLPETRHSARSARFSAFSPDDFATREAFILARKPDRHPAR